MLKYILKRLVYIVIVAFILSFFLYTIYNFIDIDYAALRLQGQEVQLQKEGRYEEVYQALRQKMRLDEPLPMRYLYWMGLAPIDGQFDGLLQGNFGYSYNYSTDDVLGLLKEPLKNTVFINIFATILALGITIPLGIFCAVKKGSKRDTAVQVGTIVGYSIPSFIIAILFIWLFAVQLKLFPVAGMSTPNSNFTGFRAFLDKLYYMALPLIVMTFSSLGGMTRYVRSSMIEALSMDCIRTARAKGLKEKVVIYSHAWRNALIPIVTLVIGWFLGIFSGSLIIENMFGLNGLGKVYITALNTKDYEVAMALQMFYVVLGLAGNLLIDLAYGLVDPRVRVNK
ncbi:MAG: ABC transporter permease [Ruminococcaceae bacterium]|nr:ABC transporter permease [Oscillospiraceae bacterium]MBQ9692017.1 ABC transporter permease [Clostridia bacterium]